MGQAAKNANTIFYPPGGILLWLIIFLELLTFGAALIAMLVSASASPAVFKESQQHLNVVLGTINTLVLLSSGYFIARAVNHYEQLQPQKAVRHAQLAMAFGLLFIGIKAVEYAQKIEQGFTIGKNTFFQFYWMLTGFHLVHVLVGLVILFVLARGMRTQKAKLEDVEAGAAFWHMCDLIWLFLFPTFYLLV